MTATWRYMIEDQVGAAAGLATDEALMANFGRNSPPAPPILRLYTYRDYSALVGRYQHLDAEVNLEVCRQRQVEFNRRPTGGGAIVMGQDQLGVALVTRAPAHQRPRDLLEEFSGAIARGLASLGIESEFRGKNDLEVAGRKVAGLGVYLDGKGAALFHASVLADLDIDFMLEVLQIPAAKVAGKGAATVRERLATVSDLLGRRVTASDIRPVIADGFRHHLEVTLAPSELTDSEQAARDHLVETRYATSDWLHQAAPTPDSTATAAIATPAGVVRAYLALSGQTIKSVLFTGDFTAVPPALLELEAALKWKRLNQAELARVAAATCPDGTGLGVPNDTVLSALLEAGRRARIDTAIAEPDRAGSCYFPEVVSS